MKKLYLSVTCLADWDIPDDCSEEEIEAIVYDFINKNGLTDIYNDAEWEVF